MIGPIGLWFKIYNEEEIYSRVMSKRGSPIIFTVSLQFTHNSSYCIIFYIIIQYLTILFAEFDFLNLNAD